MTEQMGKHQSILIFLQNKFFVVVALDIDGFILERVK